MNAPRDFLPFPLPPADTTLAETSSDAASKATTEAPYWPAEIDDSWPLEIDDECLDALVPEDDFESLPEYGDFWPDRDAA